MTQSRTEVVIIGAGPYALSIAAHLRARGVDFRIFGKPLATWSEHMPRGMFLKSEGSASSLNDPRGEYPLSRFCAEEKLRYQDQDLPVSIETFVRYGLAFQRRLVPNLEEVMVAGLNEGPDGFEVRLADGEVVRAGRVIVAVGVSHAAHVPAELTGLPQELLTHSSRHHDLGRFAGRSVAVVGAGQSALETATLLHEAGVEVRLIARRPELQWNALPVPGPRRLRQRLTRPMSMLGPGLGPWLYCQAPGMFRYLRKEVRLRRAFKTLPPAGGWWLKDRFVGRVPTELGCQVAAVESNGRVTLHLKRLDGGAGRITADHVIAATGYRFTLASLPFMTDGLRNRVRTAPGGPLLSANFESSIHGLYFTGLAATHQFGPVMRFIAGTGYTARRIARHVASGRGRGNARSRLASLGHESGPREPHDPVRHGMAVLSRKAGGDGVAASREG